MHTGATIQSQPEMMGATVTLMRLDDELKACLELEADSVGLRQLPA
jgi:dihydroxyacetone kinase-like protein